MDKKIQRKLPDSGGPANYSGTEPKGSTGQKPPTRAITLQQLEGLKSIQENWRTLKSFHEETKELLSKLEENSSVFVKCQQEVEIAKQLLKDEESFSKNFSRLHLFFGRFKEICNDPSTPLSRNPTSKEKEDLLRLSYEIEHMMNLLSVTATTFTQPVLKNIRNPVGTLNQIDKLTLSQRGMSVIVDTLPFATEKGKQQIEKILSGKSELTDLSAADLCMIRRTLAKVVPTMPLGSPLRISYERTERAIVSLERIKDALDKASTNAAERKMPMFHDYLGQVASAVEVYFNTHDTESLMAILNRASKDRHVQSFVKDMKMQIVELNKFILER